MEQAKFVIKRWIHRGILDVSRVDELGGNEALVKFLELEYSDQPKTVKEAIVEYLKTTTCGIGGYSQATALEVHSKKRSANAAEAAQRYLDTHGKDKLSTVKRTAAFKGVESRIAKHIADGFSRTEAIHKSYTDALAVKGAKIALQLGVKAETKQEQIQLSGFQKKKSFSLLTEAEKKAKSVAWKKTNLLNANVANLLVKYNPGFSEIDISVLSDTEIEEWYSEYVSIRSTIGIMTFNKSGSVPKYKNGHYLSVKTGKTHWYRSSFEKRFYEFLDFSEWCVDYESEPYHIKLANGKRYVPDLTVTSVSGKKSVIEIKPDFKVEEFMKDKGELVFAALSNFHIITTSMIDKDKINEYAAVHFGDK